MRTSRVAGGNALIHRDAMQPGKPSFAGKTRRVSKRTESVLRGVARVLVTAQHAERQRKDATLPAAHNFAEGLRVARQGTFNHLFVSRDRFHSVRVTRSEAVQMRVPNSRAHNVLDAPPSSAVGKVSHGPGQPAVKWYEKVGIGRVNRNISAVKDSQTIDR